MKKIYVISGGPGFGKSTLINALEESGFYCGKDVARKYIKEQICTGGNILPWNNRIKFSEIILKKRIKQYRDAPEEKVCFFDRGIPDLIGYFIKNELTVPDQYYTAAKKFRYQRIIFFTPPWQKLFERDHERHETFKEAVAIHNVIKKVYQNLGYKIINIPKVSTAKRVDFILSKI